MWSVVCGALAALAAYNSPASGSGNAVLILSILLAAILLPCARLAPASQPHLALVHVAYSFTYAAMYFATLLYTVTHDLLYTSILFGSALVRALDLLAHVVSLAVVGLSRLSQYPPRTVGRGLAWVIISPRVTRYGRVTEGANGWRKKRRLPRSYMGGEKRPSWEERKERREWGGTKEWHASLAQRTLRRADSGPVSSNLPSQIKVASTTRDGATFKLQVDLSVEVATGIHPADQAISFDNPKLVERIKLAYRLGVRKDARATVRVEKRLEQVFLRTLDGRTLVLSLPPSTTITELKKVVERKTGISTGSQVITHAGRVLRGNATLAAHGIEAQSTIHTTLRLRGGIGGRAPPAALYSEDEFDELDDDDVLVEALDTFRPAPDPTLHAIHRAPFPPSRAHAPAIRSFARVSGPSTAPRPSSSLAPVGTAAEYASPIPHVKKRKIDGGGAVGVTRMAAASESKDKGKGKAFAVNELRGVGEAGGLKHKQAQAEEDGDGRATLAAGRKGKKNLKVSPTSSTSSKASSTSSTTSSKASSTSSTTSSKASSTASTTSSKASSKSSKAVGRLDGLDLEQGWRGETLGKGGYPVCKTGRRVQVPARHRPRQQRRHPAPAERRLDGLVFSNAAGQQFFWSAATGEDDAEMTAAARTFVDANPFGTSTKAPEYSFRGCAPGREELIEMFERMRMGGDGDEALQQLAQASRRSAMKESKQDRTNYEASLKKRQTSLAKSTYSKTKLEPADIASLIGVKDHTPPESAYLVDGVDGDLDCYIAKHAETRRIVASKLTRSGSLANMPSNLLQVPARNKILSIRGWSRPRLVARLIKPSGNGQCHAKVVVVASRDRSTLIVLSGSAKVSDLGLGRYSYEEGGTCSNASVEWNRLELWPLASSQARDIMASLDKDFDQLRRDCRLIWDEEKAFGVPYLPVAPLPLKELYPHDYRLPTVAAPYARRARRGGKGAARKYSEEARIAMSAGAQKTNSKKWMTQLEECCGPNVKEVFLNPSSSKSKSGSVSFFLALPSFAAAGIPNCQAKFSDDARRRGKTPLPAAGASLAARDAYQFSNNNSDPPGPATGRFSVQARPDDHYTICLSVLPAPGQAPWSFEMTDMTTFSEKIPFTNDTFDLLQDYAALICLFVDKKAVATADGRLSGDPLVDEDVLCELAYEAVTEYARRADEEDLGAGDDE
ncbi:hypothetical protein JCM10296v2_006286 [Rhodotorula toruloides]